jgi:hypothetical protein
MYLNTNLNKYEAGQTDTQTINYGPGQADRHEGSRKDTNVTGQTKLDGRTNGPGTACYKKAEEEVGKL